MESTPSPHGQPHKFVSGPGDRCLEPKHEGKININYVLINVLHVLTFDDVT